MTLFVDSGVLVGYENPRDANHEAAVRIIDRAAEGAFGEIFSSDYVLDEAVTLALARTRNRELARRVGRLVLGSGPMGRILGLAYVGPQTFLGAWVLFSRLAERGLSFTDCTSLELMRRLGADEVASFDRDFDGLVTRRDDATP